MAIDSFGTPEVSIAGGLVARSGHVVAHIAGEKFRLCFTIDDDGSWRWSPGVPAGEIVPQSLETAISSAVSAAVATNELAPE